MNEHVPPAWQGARLWAWDVLRLFEWRYDDRSEAPLKGWAQLRSYPFITIYVRLIDATDQPGISPNDELASFLSGVPSTAVRQLTTPNVHVISSTFDLDTDLLADRLEYFETLPNGRAIEVEAVSQFHPQYELKAVFPGVMVSSLLHHLATAEA